MGSEVGTGGALYRTGRLRVVGLTLLDTHDTIFIVPASHIQKSREVHRCLIGTVLNVRTSVSCAVQRAKRPQTLGANNGA